jgi:hypothetical protein
MILEDEIVTLGMRHRNIIDIFQDQIVYSKKFVTTQSGLTCPKHTKFRISSMFQRSGNSREIINLTCHIKLRDGYEYIHYRIDFQFTRQDIKDIFYRL